VSNLIIKINSTIYPAILLIAAHLVLEFRPSSCIRNYLLIIHTNLPIGRQTFIDWSLKILIVLLLNEQHTCLPPESLPDLL
jgi:hypothetical protein